MNENLENHTFSRPLEEAYKQFKDTLSAEFIEAWFGREKVDDMRRAMKLKEAPPTDSLLKAILVNSGANLLALRPIFLLGKKRSIRSELLEALPHAKLNMLFGEVWPGENYPGHEAAVAKLSALSWRRGGRSAAAIVRALGLDPFFAGKMGERREASYAIDAFGHLPPLKPFQLGLIQAIRTTLTESSRVMVSSFTGTGKTRVGMEYVAEVLQGQNPGLVVWIAQKNELIDQACDSMEQLWPWLGQSSGSQLRILRYSEGSQLGESELSLRPCLLVATSSQLIMRMHSGDAFAANALKNARMLVVDEAHYALAEGHQRIVKNYFNLRRSVGRDGKLLGLTATPGRSNLHHGGESFLLAELFGNKLVVPDVPSGGEGLRWFQEKGYLSKLIHETVELNEQGAQGATAILGKSRIDKVFRQRSIPQSALTSLGARPTYNKKIAELLESLMRQGKRTIVYCCSIRQTTVLASLLASMNVESGVIHHELDYRDRRQTLQRFRNGEIAILLNVEVLTTGFDAPCVDTIVMCRPTMSRVLYEQMIGRGMRGPQMGGTAKCRVVDFTGSGLAFKEPLAWEAFWENWNLDAQRPSEPEGDSNWEIIRAKVVPGEN